MGWVSKRKRFNVSYLGYTLVLDGIELYYCEMRGESSSREATCPVGVTMNCVRGEGTVILYLPRRRGSDGARPPFLLLVYEEGPAASPTCCVFPRPF